MSLKKQLFTLPLTNKERYNLYLKRDKRAGG